MMPEISFSLLVLFFVLFCPGKGIHGKRDERGDLDIQEAEDLKIIVTSIKR